MAAFPAVIAPRIVRDISIALAAALVVAGSFWIAPPVETQTARPARVAGKPNLNGIWQAMNTANYDILSHSAKAALAMRPGPVVPVPAAPVLALGAVGSVPAGIGIDTTNPSVGSFTLDSGQTGWGLKSECTTPCISPLHTHDPTGIIHTESSNPKPHVLGQFFTQWDVKLDASCVGGYCRPAATISYYVDGIPSTGDPTQIELADGREIAIVIGSPPEIIPSTFDTSTA